MDKLEINFVETISSIGIEGWNALAGTDNPFTRYEFLHALEQAGCTTAATGWGPHHIAVYSGTGSGRVLQAVMPLYLKSNSWGEYVFDWSWANAYKNHGLAYYPKLVSAVPFTPSVGTRLFVRSPDLRSRIAGFVCEKVIEEAQRRAASSWHILFPTAAEHDEFDRRGIHARVGSQFHWYNKGYTSFDEFLATLNSRKRKSIRKERQSVRNEGITFKRSEGAEIDEAQWQTFIRYYESTYMMRGMQGYLNKDFFQTLSSTMPESLFMITAQQQGKDIAAALFFKSSDQLFGRYWGSDRDHRFLHFETCYYQGQDYCIEHGLKSFDSGAQGEHKIQRGFEPILTFSNHWIENEGFADAIGNFLNDEKAHINDYIKQAKQLLPYKTESK